MGIAVPVRQRANAGTAAAFAAQLLFEDRLGGGFCDLDVVTLVHQRDPLCHICLTIARRG
jgi:hypothetical protein